MDDAPGGRILVAVDGSDSSKDALRTGARLAEALGAPLDAVLCWELPPFFEGFRDDEQQLRNRSARLLETTLEEVFGDGRPGELRSRLVHGQPGTRLVEESEGAQMLVVGRRGRGGITGMFMGSVSSALVSHAHCPVLVVRG